MAPCWYCIECKVNNEHSLDTWVCNSCEKKIDDMLPWTFLKHYQVELRTAVVHNAQHHLVRVVHTLPSGTKEGGIVVPTDPSVTPITWTLVSERFDAADSSVDKHFTGMETRLEGVESRFKEVDSRLEQMESRLTQIDSRMEQMLNILMQTK